MLAAGVLLWQMSGNTPYRVVNVGEAHAMLAEDSTLVLLDVRTREEFSGGHLRGALLIPVQELDDRLGELEDLKDRPILVYCRTGNRSGIAAGMLQKKGFTAMNMAGGIVDWNAQGFPVERPGR